MPTRNMLFGAFILTILLYYSLNIVRIVERPVMLSSKARHEMKPAIKWSWLQNELSRQMKPSIRSSQLSDGVNYQVK